MATTEEEKTESTTPTGQQLVDIHGVWAEHVTWPVSDWKYEVDNDDTRLGYWDWVASQMEIHGSSDESED